MNFHVTPQEAREELQRRAEARAEQKWRDVRRENLIDYALSIDIPGAPIKPDDPDCEEFNPIVAPRMAHHHRLWLGCLQRVENGELKRLLGFMPPGAGKSIYTSVVFPTHFMGRFPQSNIIVTSYGADLPKKFGRRARAIVKQEAFRRIFGTKLTADSKAADQWELENESTFMGAGILADITGNRANGVIWDDPLKGREQADSETFRNKTWDSYFDNLLSRKKPHAWEIGILTRWHQDDPAGRILPAKYNGESGWIKGRDGNDWFVVCLPAIAEREDDLLGRKIGDRIWPEWFPENHFEPFRINPRTWSALYQQRPAPAEGEFFKKSWLRPYTLEQRPDLKTLAIYGGSDYATKKDGGDYTVHVVIGVDPEDRPWLLDLWRQQATSDHWILAWCDLVAKWKPLFWGEERGQIISGVGPFLEREAKKRRTYTTREQFTSGANKRIMAGSIQGYIATHGLYVPTYEPWYEAFESELLVFDAGVHDDQVDAIAKVGLLLDKMAMGRKIKIPTVQVISGYETPEENLIGGDRDSFKTL